jgi:mono/diheme cytochrome c family protein
MKPVLFLCMVTGLISATAPGNAETLLERGAYLVQGPMACGNCHTPMGPDGPVSGRELAGGSVLEAPEFTVHVPNITPGSRVSEWSDAELALAIREGMLPDGSVIRPPMPIGLYRNISDTDLAAVVAYLRQVPAVANEVSDSTYNVPVPPSYGPPVGSVPDPARGATVEYGAYLVAIAHCMECHTPLGPAGPRMDTDLGRGGTEFAGPWGTSVAANITSSPDGLDEYSDGEIAAMITKGVHADGSPMSPPMPYGFLANLAPEDLDAMILYLRTVPPLSDLD